jgi:hypothetical protein
VASSFLLRAASTFVASMCSAEGGPLGQLLLTPALRVVDIVAAFLAFVAGLTAAAKTIFKRQYDPNQVVRCRCDAGFPAEFGPSGFLGAVW